MANGIVYYSSNRGGFEDGPVSTTDQEIHHPAYIVRELYNECMTHKKKTGLQSRLTWAYLYLTTDRPTAFNLKAQAHDEEMGDDCEDGVCDDVITVSFDFIGSQHNIAMSVFQDSLKFRNQDYVTVSPTPVADLSKDEKKNVRRQVFDALSQEILGAVSASGADQEDQVLLSLEAIHSLLGTDDGLAEIDSFINRFKKIENSRRQAEANVKGRNAKAMIDDEIAESNFDEVMHVFGGQAFWYDYAVMRAPYKVEKKTTKITPTGRLTETTKSVWQMENIHPLNHFYTEDTEFNKLGSGEGDVTWLSRSDILGIKDMKGSVDKDIEYVLKNFASYTYTGTTSDADHEDNDMDTYRYTDKIPVIRAIMRLENAVVKKIFGPEFSGNVKGSSMVEFWVANDRVLYQKIEPRYLDYNPYRKNGYKIKDLTEIASSRGIYSILRSAQELIDNSARNLFGNLQNLPNYITEINQSKLKNPEDVEDDLKDEFPVIYTSSLGYRAEFGGNDRAVSIITIPDNISTYVSAMREAIDLAKQLGFSSFALGQQNPSNVRSAGQAAILNSNGNRDFSRMFQQQEDFVESPIAEYIWVAEAIERKDPSIVVDSKINVQTYTGFLQQETESEDLSLLGQNLAALFNQRAQLKQIGEDTSWLDSLIRDYATKSGLSEESTPFGDDLGSLTESLGVSATPAGPAEADPVPIPLDGRSNVPPEALQNTPV